MMTISRAAKFFDVSRPTLLKHLKAGKISGNKDDDKGWQIDTAELARVYQPRGAEGAKYVPADLPPVSSDLTDDLKAENERLRRDLAVAEALADERGTRLDQLVPLLMAPKTRRWWLF
jgi:predicted site-specific integrase-resolvase